MTLACPPCLLFPRVDELHGALLGGESAIVPHRLLIGFVGLHALLDEIGHFAEGNELVADHFAVRVQREAGDVSLRHFQIPNPLLQGGIHRADLRTMPLAEVLEARADRQTVVGESGLRTAVDDLQEKLPHRRVDGVADEIGIQRLQGRFAGKNLGRHRRGMGHTGAADRLDERLLNNAFLDVESELAGTLLRRAPADAVRETADVLDLLRVNPLALFGNRGIFMTGNARALGDAEHLCNIL